MKKFAHRARLAAAACACLSASLALAETATPAGAGPWTRVPPLSTLCYQKTGETDDPFYARLAAAKEAVQADRERQEAINAKIEEEMRSIDPMERAQRMQQWMMSNPQEAMSVMQGQQAAAANVADDIATLEQQTKAPGVALSAISQQFADARIAAYAPIEPRRKAFAAKLGHPYSTKREDLAAAATRFYQDPSTPTADWIEGENLSKAYDQAYEKLCPSWWGPNGKIQAHMKQQKDWYLRERVPFLEKSDAPKLQQYAMMSTPAATYRSTAQFKAVEEYLDYAVKVYNERPISSRCVFPRDCDGAYP